jgi:RNA polymerase sigma factor (TIGR02999 family)
MVSANTVQATQTLVELGGGDRSAAERLFPFVYDELRSVAGRMLRRETPDCLLQPTELVHEAFLRLIDQTRVDWQGRTHFLAVAAQAMRRVLVDHARHRHRLKRGGGRTRIQYDDDELMVSTKNDADVLDVDAALHRLADLDPRNARIVEMRFFGGMTVEEVATALALSKSTVEKEWMACRAWLRRELSEDRT